jgi:hypothetical protein
MVHGGSDSELAFAETGLAAGLGLELSSSEFTAAAGAERVASGHAAAVGALI